MLEEKKLIFLIDKNQIKLLPDKIFSFEGNEVIDGKIYNQTAIASCISKYLIEQGLQNLPAHILFTDDFLEYEICKEVKDDFGDSPKIKLKLGEGRYLIAKVAPEILFQYQLLFFKMGIYLEVVTGQMFERARRLPKDVLSGVDSVEELFIG